MTFDHLIDKKSQMIESPQAQMAMGFLLRQIQEYAEQMSPGQFTKEQLEEMDKGLKAL